MLSGARRNEVLDLRPPQARHPLIAEYRPDLRRAFVELQSSVALNFANRSPRKKCVELVSERSRCLFVELAHLQTKPQLQVDPLSRLARRQGACGQVSNANLVRA